jgi:hypothetical protein
MRIRAIKPEFWRSDDIDRLDWHTRLLFIGLWSYVDDNGVGRDRESDIDRLDWHTRLLFIGLWSYVDDNGVGRDRESDIAADLFSSDLSRDPRDTLARVADGLQQLSAGGQITRYTVAGKAFLYVIAWENHQKIDRPAKARYPLPDKADPPETKGSSDSSRDHRETVANVSRDRRETPSTGTGEQGNRGTGEQQQKTPSSVGRAKTRGTRIPDNWMPTPTLIEDMRAEGIPDDIARAELPRFRDYWAGVAGAKGRKVDWDATWRNWLRRAADDRRPSAGLTPLTRTPAVGTATAKAQGWLALADPTIESRLA